MAKILKFRPKKKTKTKTKVAVETVKTEPDDMLDYVKGLRSMFTEAEVDEIRRGLEE